jgi:hypothetical protein
MVLKFGIFEGRACKRLPRGVTENVSWKGIFHVGGVTTFLCVEKHRHADLKERPRSCRAAVLELSRLPYIMVLSLN